MVDDGSTDNTRELLEKLRNAHSEIRVILHNTNQGGGATRNTAVADAKGQVIFCLDSDDILPDNTLAKMLEYIQTTRSDGVLFAETRFFTSNRPKKFEIVRNSITDRAVVFADLFRQNSGFLTRVNFMFTKNAFLSAGGYPTNHGFDTQTFGVRFLANGQKALVCPNTAYLHRRNSGLVLPILG
jgi:glycosyltransferase involved in cell wall biosynthesis